MPLLPRPMSILLTRLQLATRIHFAVTRLLGHGIDLRRLMLDTLYAQQVLVACRALDDPALAALIDRFAATTPQDDRQAHLADAARRTRAALAQLGRAAAESTATAAQPTSVCGQ